MITRAPMMVRKQSVAAVVDSIGWECGTVKSHLGVIIKVVGRCRPLIARWS